MNAEVKKNPLLRRLQSLSETFFFGKELHRAVSGTAATAESPLVDPSLKPTELRELIKRSSVAKNINKPTLRPHAVPEQIEQWKKLNYRVTEPFHAPEIARKDVFAVIEAGASQFKVVPDDKIFVPKLSGVDIDDVIQFNRVLLVGTPNDTVLGRPLIHSVQVVGCIEEHIRDATTYIYKRRRAKGYRRFRGFRAELTAVRILSVVGVERYVPVPAWTDGVSTPLQKNESFGLQVRKRRKRLRAAQISEEREMVQHHLESGHQFGIQSSGTESQS